MTLYDLFRGSVQDFPNSIAVICGDDQLTYAQLNEKVDSLTEELLNWGVEKGERVGVLYPNGTYYPVFLYALIRIGAVFMPFNTQLTHEEIVQLIQDADCTTFIYHECFPEQGMKPEIRKSKLKRIIKGNQNGIGTCATSSEIELADGESIPVSGDDPGLIMFTGGTTGKATGVLTTHEALVSRVVMKYRDVQRTMHDDIMLNHAPLFHTGGLSLMIQTLSAGGCFVMSEKFNPEAIIEECDKYKATQVALIPPNIVYRIAAASNMSREKLSSVRLGIMAGGFTDEAIAEKTFDTFPNIELYLNYGSSENSITLGHVMNREDFRKYPWRIKSQGIANMASFVKLLDEEGNGVPPGMPGEAWGKSPCQMKEYLSKCSRAVNGWIPTGDIFVKDEDGYYYFVCRKKNMIKSGGENVYPEEVENILRHHDAVKDCLIFAVPDKDYGEGVAAAVILKENTELTGAALIDYCRGRMAGFKKPRKIYFVEKFPMTAVGKIARNELIQSLLEKSPDFSR